MANDLQSSWFAQQLENNRPMIQRDLSMPEHCSGIGIDWGQNARPQWRPSTKPALHNTRLHYDQTRSIRGWVCFRVACKLMTGLLLLWCIYGCQSVQSQFALWSLDMPWWHWINTIDIFRESEGKLYGRIPLHGQAKWLVASQAARSWNTRQHRAKSHCGGLKTQDERLVFSCSMRRYHGI